MLKQTLSFLSLHFPNIPSQKSSFSIPAFRMLFPLKSILQLTVNGSYFHKVKFYILRLKIILLLLRHPSHHAKKGRKTNH